jgi:arsenate reductase
LRHVAQSLGLIRNAGVEPHIVEHLKTPPARALIRQLAARAGVPLRALLRDKEPVFRELGLNGDDLAEDAVLDAFEAHPILLNRPIVVTPKGVRLCRPSELVIDLLPPQQGEFFKGTAGSQPLEVARASSISRKSCSTFSIRTCSNSLNLFWTRSDGQLNDKALFDGGFGFLLDRQCLADLSARDPNLVPHRDLILQPES